MKQELIEPFQELWDENFRKKVMKEYDEKVYRIKKNYNECGINEKIKIQYINKKSF